MRFRFNYPSTVSKVVIKKGHSHKPGNIYKVSVCNGEEKTLCGTYTPAHLDYFDETVDCGSVRGDSAIIELNFCINIHEIEIYGELAPGEINVGYFNEFKLFVIVNILPFVIENILPFKWFCKLDCIFYVVCSCALFC